MDALNRVLHRHRRHAGKTGDERSRRVAVRERPERDRKHEKRDEQQHLPGQEQRHRRPLPPRQQVGSDTDESDNEHELRQCQQLGDGAMGAEHQCCAKRHEVAGYVGSEEPLQAEKAGTNTGESGTLRATNVIGGVQAGYNWVLPGPYLFGLEADISGTDISSTALTSPPGDPSAVAQWNDKVNTFGTARARLGYIAGPWLFYATGGFGWEYDKLTRTQLMAPEKLAPPFLFVDTNALQSGASVTASHLRAGWTAGAGVEWAFARTWTVKLEYLHIDTQSELMSSGRLNFAV
jgi:opacity protein-like surface antigen